MIQFHAYLKNFYFRPAYTKFCLHLTQICFFVYIFNQLLLFLIKTVWQDDSHPVFPAQLDAVMRNFTQLVVSYCCCFLLPLLLLLLLLAIDILVCCCFSIPYTMVFGT